MRRSLLPAKSTNEGSLSGAFKGLHQPRRKSGNRSNSGGKALRMPPPKRTCRRHSLPTKEAELLPCHPLNLPLRRHFSRYPARFSSYRSGDQLLADIKPMRNAQDRADGKARTLKSKTRLFRRKSQADRQKISSKGGLAIDTFGHGQTLIAPYSRHRNARIMGAILTRFEVAEQRYGGVKSAPDPSWSLR